MGNAKGRQVYVMDQQVKEALRAASATGVASVGSTVGAVPWWGAILVLVVGCGPEIRATAATVSDIRWRWKHPKCTCHEGPDDPASLPR